MKFLIYSHTHWDREWYLSQTQFQYRLVRTIDEIVALLEAGNGFDTFVLDGQTSIIQDYLALRPEREDCLRRLIAAGKLVIGPWYTMPDTFLPGGEALIRNLQRGHADCLQYGARYPNTGYVPDSFGHIEQMPQLMRGVGIDNYIYSRGRPAALDVRAGHKLEFFWRAPDGSAVLAYNLPDGYFNARFLPAPAASDALRQRMLRMAEAFAASHCPGLILAAHGIDHSWLQRDIADILRALPALMPQAGFYHGSIEEAMNRIRAAMPRNLEVYEGQMRGPLRIDELHGTLSSRMDNKIWNARSAMFLEGLAEPLDAVAAGYGGAAQPCHLRRAWELVCQNHAHDSICGCSQDRVHDEVNIRFRQAAEIATDVADAALDLLNSAARRAGRPEVAVFAGLNGGHRLVDFVLRLPERPRRGLWMRDDRGRSHAVQVEGVEQLRIVHTNATVECFEVRGAVSLPDLRPCELRRLQPVTDGDPPAVGNPVRCDGRALDNGLVRVSVNDNGTLDLLDHRSGVAISGTHFFTHEMDLGGGYHFEPLPGDERRDTRGGRARVRRVAAGPLRAALEVAVSLRVPRRYDRERRRPAGRAIIRFTSTLLLEAGSDTILVSTVIDNGAQNQRIRLALPTHLADAAFHADASFAVHANTPQQWPSVSRQNSHPMRSFVDIAAARGGLAFLGRGQHEYEMTSAPQGCGVEVTLLRCADFVFLCSTWETPGAQLPGKMRHDYALRLHQGDCSGGGVALSAAAFNHPAVSQASGDSLHPREHEDHATIGIYALRRGVAVPLDTNRSPWHVNNAHRDGWRRIEQERFPDVTVPSTLVPFEIAGDHMIVSAFKRAANGSGVILRFWNAAGREQRATVRAAAPAAVLTRVNLLEQPLEPLMSANGALRLDVRPFEIVTIHIAPAAAGPLP